MSRVQDRIKATVERLGDDFTVSSSTRQGVFRVLDGQTAEDLLSSTEIAAAEKPLYWAIVPFDDTTTASDEVTWLGTDYGVLKILDLRLRNETVAKKLILDSGATGGTGGGGGGTS